MAGGLHLRSEASRKLQFQKLKASFNGMRVCPLEHTGYGFLSLLLDPPSVSFIAKTIGIDLVKISSVPDGRAANHPSSAITLIPPNGRPFPGAALRQFFDRASALISRLEIEFGKIASSIDRRG